jgi:hypothetical protein
MLMGSQRPEGLGPGEYSPGVPGPGLDGGFGGPRTDSPGHSDPPGGRRFQDTACVQLGAMARPSLTMGGAAPENNGIKRNKIKERGHI